MERREEEVKREREEERGLKDRGRGGGEGVRTRGVYPRFSFRHRLVV